MADTKSLPTIFATFPDQAAGERAVNELANAGLSAAEIGFLVPGDTSVPNCFNPS